MGERANKWKQQQQIFSFSVHIGICTRTVVLHTISVAAAKIKEMEYYRKDQTKREAFAELYAHAHIISFPCVWQGIFCTTKEQTPKVARYHWDLASKNVDPALDSVPPKCLRAAYTTCATYIFNIDRYVQYETFLYAITVKWGSLSLSYTCAHSYTHPNISIMMIITVIMILSLCIHLLTDSFSLCQNAFAFFHPYNMCVCINMDPKNGSLCESEGKTERIDSTIPFAIAFAFAFAIAIHIKITECDTHSLIRIFNHTHETFEHRSNWINKPRKLKYPT